MGGSRWFAEYAIENENISVVLFRFVVLSSCVLGG